MGLSRVEPERAGDVAAVQRAVLDREVRQEPLGGRRAAPRRVPTQLSSNASSSVRRPSARGGRPGRSNEVGNLGHAPRAFVAVRGPRIGRRRRRGQATGDRLARSAVRLVAPLAATPTAVPRRSGSRNSARCVMTGETGLVIGKSRFMVEREGLEERASRRPLLALGDATHPIDSRPRGEQTRSSGPSPTTWYAMGAPGSHSTIGANTS